MRKQFFSIARVLYVGAVLLALAFGTVAAVAPAASTQDCTGCWTGGHPDPDDFCKLCCGTGEAMCLASHDICIC